MGQYLRFIYRSLVCIDLLVVVIMLVRVLVREYIFRCTEERRRGRYMCTWYIYINLGWLGV